VALRRRMFLFPLLRSGALVVPAKLTDHHGGQEAVGIDGVLLRHIAGSTQSPSKDNLSVHILALVSDTLLGSVVL